MLIPPIAIAYLATLAFSCVDASIGYLTNVQGISVVQTILVRTGAVFILGLSYLLYTRPEHSPFGPPLVRHLIWLRGVIYGAGLYLGYWSLQYLTLSEFLTLYCLLPFFTGLLCWIFVKEPFTWTQGICCCISILGVILVTDPLGRTQPDLRARGVDDHLPTTLGAKLIGVGLCLPDVMLQASEVLVMRLIKDQASTVQILTIMSICPSSVAALAMGIGATVWVDPKIPIGWILLFGIIPLGLIAQYSFTYATSKVSGTQVAIVQYSGVVFGTLIQWLVYGNHPSLTAAMGMGLIIICGVYDAVYGTAKDENDEGDGPEYIALPTQSQDEETGR